MVTRPPSRIPRKTIGSHHGPCCVFRDINFSSVIMKIPSLNVRPLCPFHIRLLWRNLLNKTYSEPPPPPQLLLRFSREDRFGTPGPENKVDSGRNECVCKRVKESSICRKKYRMTTMSSLDVCNAVQQPTPQ